MREHQNGFEKKNIEHLCSREYEAEKPRLNGKKEILKQRQSEIQTNLTQD